MVRLPRSGTRHVVMENWPYSCSSQLLPLFLITRSLAHETIQDQYARVLKSHVTCKTGKTTKILRLPSHRHQPLPKIIPQFQIHITSLELITPVSMPSSFPKGAKSGAFVYQNLNLISIYRGPVPQQRTLIPPPYYQYLRVVNSSFPSPKSPHPSLPAGNFQTPQLNSKFQISPSQVGDQHRLH